MKHRPTVLVTLSRRSESVLQCFCAVLFVIRLRVMLLERALFALLRLKASFLSSIFTHISLNFFRTFILNTAIFSFVFAQELVSFHNATTEVFRRPMQTTDGTRSRHCDTLSLVLEYNYAALYAFHLSRPEGNPK